MSRRKIFYATLIPLIAAWLLVTAAPREIDIRLDSGDLRYTAFGIPVQYRQTIEPERSRLIAATAGSKTATPTWVRVLPQTTSNCNSCVYQSYYRMAAQIGVVDPTLCRLLAEDFAAQIAAANGRKYVGPTWFPAIPQVILKFPENDWATQPAIVEFCRQRGYAIVADAQAGRSPHLVPLR